MVCAIIGVVVVVKIYSCCISSVSVGGCVCRLALNVKFASYLASVRDLKAAVINVSSESVTVATVRHVDR